MCYNVYGAFEVYLKYVQEVKIMNKLEVACFSGHRRLPRDCAELKRRLKSAVIDLIERGVVFFGAGGALGFGMIAEETVLN